MGMIASWFFRLTSPFRNFTVGVRSLKRSLGMTFFGTPKRYKNELLGDVRQIKRMVGVKDPPPGAPPKK